MMDRTGIVGADVARLAATAQRFSSAARDFRSIADRIAALLGAAEWTGTDAAVVRGQWQRAGRPSIIRAADFLEELGAVLQRHADDQQQASAIVGPSTGRNDTTGPIGFGSRHRFGPRSGDPNPTVRLHPVGSYVSPGLRGRGHQRIDVPSGVRAAVVAAFGGIADPDRIRRDEIEIRALDDGRYIVVLPGVTDLSSGVGEFVGGLHGGLLGAALGAQDALETWADNDEPTVRKMRYAYDAAQRDDIDHNEYASAAIDALQAAGVPSGAEVMLVGHSFGAYAAIDLAANPNVNLSHGAIGVGYRVAVTHVVAAGADTDWRFDELPAGTSTLVVNNRFDAVYRAENALHDDGEPSHAGHSEQHFWGGLSGAGHDEEIYLDWLATTDRPSVEQWFDAIGDRYTAGGERVSVRVPDPNLPGAPADSASSVPLWWSRPASIR